MLSCKRIFQSLYETYGPDHEAVAVLSVATPGCNGEGSEVKAFLEKNGYTYPVLMDPTGEVMNRYGVSAIPTTFMIDPAGNVCGYVPGAMDGETMRSIVEQTLQGAAG